VTGGVIAILQLHDVDLMLSEVRNAASLARLRKMGFEVKDPQLLERTRARLVAALDPRWLSHYERALRRYGRAVAPVRGRVCSGCFITLPTSVTPAAEEALTLCESCGRILYWR
jgi:predicted  nucleic acid-binding Zn-ribbon protein